jgi:hypothetical protein
MGPVLHAPDGRQASEQAFWKAPLGPPRLPPICRSSAVSVGGLTSVDVVAPCLLLGFALSNGSQPQGSQRGSEQQSMTTRLRVDAHRYRRRSRCRRRRDHRVSATYPQRTRLLWRSIIRVRRSAGRRRWGALKACTGSVSSEADTPQIQCPHQDLLGQPDRVRVSRTQSVIAVARLTPGSHPPRFPGQN